MGTEDSQTGSTQSESTKKPGPAAGRLKALEGGDASRKLHDYMMNQQRRKEEYWMRKYGKVLISPHNSAQKHLRAERSLPPISSQYHAAQRGGRGHPPLFEASEPIASFPNTRNNATDKRHNANIPYHPGAALNLPPISPLKSNSADGTTKIGKATGQLLSRPQVSELGPGALKPQQSDSGVMALSVQHGSNSGTQLLTAGYAPQHHQLLTSGYPTNALADSKSCGSFSQYAPPPNAARPLFAEMSAPVLGAGAVSSVSVPAKAGVTVPSKVPCIVAEGSSQSVGGAFKAGQVMHKMPNTNIVHQKSQYGNVGPKVLARNKGLRDLEMELAVLKSIKAREDGLDRLRVACDKLSVAVEGVAHLCLPPTDPLVRLFYRLVGQLRSRTLDCIETLAAWHRRNQQGEPFLYYGSPYMRNIGPDLQFLDQHAFVRARAHGMSAVDDPFLLHITPDSIPLEEASTADMRRGGHRFSPEALRIRIARKVLHTYCGRRSPRALSPNGLESPDLHPPPKGVSVPPRTDGLDLTPNSDLDRSSSSLSSLRDEDEADYQAAVKAGNEALGPFLAPNSARSGATRHADPGQGSAAQHASMTPPPLGAVVSTNSRSGMGFIEEEQVPVTAGVDSNLASPLEGGCVEDESTMLHSQALAALEESVEQDALGIQSTLLPPPPQLSLASSSRQLRSSETAGFGSRAQQPSAEAAVLGGASSLGGRSTSLHHSTEGLAQGSAAVSLAVSGALDYALDDHAFIDFAVDAMVASLEPPYSTQLGDKPFTIAGWEIDCQLDSLIGGLAGPAHSPAAGSRRASHNPTAMPMQNTGLAEKQELEQEQTQAQKQCQQAVDQQVHGQQDMACEDVLSSALASDQSLVVAPSSSAAVETPGVNGDVMAGATAEEEMLQGAATAAAAAAAAAVIPDHATEQNALDRSGIDPCPTTDADGASAAGAVMTDFSPAADAEMTPAVAAAVGLDSSSGVGAELETALQDKAPSTVAPGPPTERRLSSPPPLQLPVDGDSMEQSADDRQREDVEAFGSPHLLQATLRPTSPFTEHVEMSTLPSDADISPLSAGAEANTLPAEAAAGATGTVKPGMHEEGASSVPDDETAQPANMAHDLTLQSDGVAEDKQGLPQLEAEASVSFQPHGVLTDEAASEPPTPSMTQPVLGSMGRGHHHPGLEALQEGEESIKADITTGNAAQEGELGLDAQEGATSRGTVTGYGKQEGVDDGNSGSEQVELGTNAQEWATSGSMADVGAQQGDLGLQDRVEGDTAGGTVVAQEEATSGGVVTEQGELGVVAQEEAASGGVVTEQGELGVVAQEEAASGGVVTQQGSPEEEGTISGVAVDDKTQQGSLELQEGGTSGGITNGHTQLGLQDREEGDTAGGKLEKVQLGVNLWGSSAKAEFGDSLRRDSAGAKSEDVVVRDLQSQAAELAVLPQAVQEGPEPEVQLLPEEHPPGDELTPPPGSGADAVQGHVDVASPSSDDINSTLLQESVTVDEDSTAAAVDREDTGQDQDTVQVTAEQSGGQEADHDSAREADQDHDSAREADQDHDSAREADQDHYTVDVQTNAAIADTQDVEGTAGVQTNSEGEGLQDVENQALNDGHAVGDVAKGGDASAQDSMQQEQEHGLGDVQEAEAEQHVVPVAELASDNSDAVEPADGSGPGGPELATDSLGRSASGVGEVSQEIDGLLSDLVSELVMPA